VNAQLISSPNRVGDSCQLKSNASLANIYGGSKSPQMNNAIDIDDKKEVENSAQPHRKSQNDSIALKPSENVL